MLDKQDLPTLDELQARNYPPADFDSIFKIKKGELPEEDREEIDEYLSHFVAENDCIACGEPVGGLFGHFKWGIVHGEGYCANCGYPMRAIHKSVGCFEKFEKILQYHPDSLRENEEDENGS